MYEVISYLFAYIKTLHSYLGDLSGPVRGCLFTAGEAVQLQLLTGEVQTTGQTVVPKANGQKYFVAASTTWFMIMLFLRHLCLFPSSLLPCLPYSLLISPPFLPVSSQFLFPSLSLPSLLFFLPLWVVGRLLTQVTSPILATLSSSQEKIYIPAMF